MSLLKENKEVLEKNINLIKLNTTIQTFVSFPKLNDKILILKTYEILNNSSKLKI